MELSSRYQRLGVNDFNSTEVEVSDGDHAEVVMRPSTGFRQPRSCCSPLQRFFDAVINWLSSHRKVSLLVAVILVLIFISVPVWLGLYAFLKYPFQIEYSLAAFQIPNHIASRHQDAFLLSKQQTRPMLKLKKSYFPQRRKRWLDYDEPPTGSTAGKAQKYSDQSQIRWHLDLVYIAKGDDDPNIFREDRLKEIHKVEQLIMQHENFERFCWKAKLAESSPILKANFSSCAPPMSLINFFFPSFSNGRLIPDGQGELSDIHETVKFLLSKSSTYWFVDNGFSRNFPKSKWLRAQVYFGFPLKGYHGAYKGPQVKSQDDEFEKFVLTYIDTLQQLSSSKLQVLYGGPEIYDFEVQSALHSDLLLAIVSLSLIVLLVFILTSFSFFLTFLGIISICTSFPLAYYFYRVPGGVSTMGILNGASIFVIIGIGVDDVFVLINTFRQSKHIDSMFNRLKHTMWIGGKATFFTSFTTAAAFGANCASQIPAVYEFGLFMALIVISCWLTVVFITPCSLYIWFYWIGPLENALFSFCKCSVCGSCGCGMMRLTLPVEVLQFLSGQKNTGDTSTRGLNNPAFSHMSELNVDVEMETVPTIHNAIITDSANPQENELSDFDADMDTIFCDDQDTALLNPEEDENLPQPIAAHGTDEECNVVFGLQKVLFHWVARPVIKFRYLVMGLYVLLIILSGFGMSRLMVSKHPPAFFAKDSNLQQLLDLKANMSSSEGICRECTQLFSDVAQGANPNPSEKPVTKNPPTTSPKNPPTTSPKNPSTSPPEPTTADHSCNELNCTTSDQPSSPPGTTSTKEPITPNSLPTKDSTTASGEKTTATTAKPTSTHPNPTQPVTTNKPATNPTEPATTAGTTLRPGLCEASKSCQPVAKPVMDRTVTVFLVFGVKGVDRSGLTGKHVLGGKGNVVFDSRFRQVMTSDLTKLAFGGAAGVISDTVISNLCKICKVVAANTSLVLKDGADCFPDKTFYDLLTKRQIKGCEGLRPPQRLKGAKSKSYVGRGKHSIVETLAMAFESTTHLDQTPSEIYESYNKWEDFIQNHVLAGNISEGLRSGFQTSPVWVTMFSEILAVNGALYGIVLSLLLCMAAVVIFTGHVMLSFIILLTILGVVCSVVAIFYLAGWELGAVEAVSLSILVGTSVDYCVHLVEGFILAGDHAPKMKNKDLRKWRSSAAVAHIGVSIISSALTTMFAAVPLCLTTIVLFAKFGEIVAINTAMSIFYTLTICLGFLSVISPAKYKRTWLSSLIAFIGMLVFVGLLALAAYVAATQGVFIPRPDGMALFKGTHQSGIGIVGLDES